MNRIKSSIFSFLSFLTIAFLSIGSSYWNVNHANKKDFPLTSVSKEEVAYFYFKDTTGTEKKRSFTSIEGALAAAGKDTSANTVFVVPGTNPTIHQDCAIASGDTLCIPYEGETYDGRQKESQKSGTWKTRATFEKGVPVSGDFIPDSSGYLTTPFADSKKEFVSYFKKNEVTISANQTLTVSSGAFLNIGGILGWADRIVTGQTSGKYCQITRKANSKIINKGTIDCRGYIKEAEKNSNSEIVMPKGNNGTRKLPCVFYDYQGGKYTASVYGGETKIFPLTQYDFPNVQSKRTFNYGSKLIGYVDLFTGEVKHSADVKLTTVTAVLAARHNADDLEIIGPTSADQKSLFEMSSESSAIVIKRNSSGNLYTTNPSLQPDSTTKIDINGEVNFQSTQISIKAAGDVSIKPKWLSGLSVLLESMTKQLNQTIDTSAVYFPLPWNILLAVNPNSSLTISSLMKMRPGSEIDVSDTGTLTIGGKLIVYDDSRNSSLFQCPSGLSDVPNPYPSDKGNAKVLNAGTRTIKNGASFGGLISAIGNSGHINVEIGANLTINDCHEGHGNYEISLSNFSNPVKFTFIDYSNSPVIKSACGARIRKYYKTDIAPSYVYENGIEQLLVAGESYSSCSSTSDAKTFGWYRKNGRNDKHGIKIVLDPKSEFSSDAEISNPNAGDIFVDYFTNKIIVLEALSDPSGKKLFKGFSYDSLGTDRLDGNGFTLNIDKAINKLVHGIVTVYANWIDVEMPAKVRTAYYEGNDLVIPDSYRSVDAGVALSLGNLTSRDREGGTDKDNFKVTYDNVDWLVNDETDGTETHVAPGSSFVPQGKHSYTIEPIYKTHYFLRINVTNKQYDSGIWFAIQEIKINDNSSDLRQKNEDTQTAWIESTDTLTIQVTNRLRNKGCTIGIPGYQPITIGKNETKIINFKTDKDSNNKPLLDAFMNRTGPINVQGTT